MNPAPVALQWQAWVAENLALGVDESAIVARLGQAGIEAATATQTVAAVAASNDLDLIGELVESTRRRQTIIELQRVLRAQAPVAVESRIDAPRFFADYYFASRPVLLPGYVRHWPAFSVWNHRWFAETFEQTSIEVCVGRDGHQTPDRAFGELTKTMSMSDYIDFIEDSHGNDAYAISNNKLMANPELAVLFDHLAPDRDIFPKAKETVSAVALWIGPGGTVTPLHHDTTNVMLCQVVGTKRVTLASPFETELADASDDFYFDGGVDTGDPVPAATRTVDVGAGDALFIPTGWWHRVEALAPSITVAMMGFAEPNDFSWYRPGSIRT